MLKSIIGGVVVTAALVSPAMANEYWVEYNYSTHECSIVEKKTPNSTTGVAQGGPAADAPADSSSSGTSTSPMSSTPQGFATPTNNTPPVVVSGTTDGANKPGTTPPGSATKNPVTAAGPVGTPTEAAAPGAPSDTSSPDKKDDPFAPLAAAWAAKKAAAEAAGTANITTVEIGTAMHSREEAEQEMQVMRKCGLKN